MLLFFYILFCFVFLLGCTSDPLKSNANMTYADIVKERAILNVDAERAAKERKDDRR